MVDPYGPECTNKSTLNKSDSISVPTPSRTSYGRIVMKNDTDKYLYGIKVLDKDDPKKVYFEDNTGAIAPGFENLVSLHYEKVSCYLIVNGSCCERCFL